MAPSWHSALKKVAECSQRLNPIADDLSDEVRAGVTGHNVRYVLMIGIIAVILLFVLAYFATNQLKAGPRGGCLANFLPQWSDLGQPSGLEISHRLFAGR